MSVGRCCTSEDSDLNSCSRYHKEVRYSARPLLSYSLSKCPQISTLNTILHVFSYACLLSSLGTRKAHKRGVCVSPLNIAIVSVTLWGRPRNGQVSVAYSIGSPMKRQVSKPALSLSWTNKCLSAQRHSLDILRHKQDLELQALRVLRSCMQGCTAGFQNVTSRLDGLCHAWNDVSHP